MGNQKADIYKPSTRGRKIRHKERPTRNIFQFINISIDGGNILSINNHLMNKILTTFDTRKFICGVENLSI